MLDRVAGLGRPACRVAERYDSNSTHHPSGVGQASRLHVYVILGYLSHGTLNPGISIINFKMLPNTLLSLTGLGLAPVSSVFETVPA
jgi:hypothetical protein